MKDNSDVVGDSPEQVSISALARIPRAVIISVAGFFDEGCAGTRQLVPHGNVTSAVVGRMSVARSHSRFQLRRE